MEIETNYNQVNKDFEQSKNLPQDYKDFIIILIILKNENID